MYIFTRVSSIMAWINAKRAAGLSIGLSPTMGALHAGHLSLIQSSKADNDISVCSIFVNPSQFNDPADLKKYPRNYNLDLALLQTVACDVVFLPPVIEIYPADLETAVSVDLNGMESRFEGEFRPGHFDGMMEVVHRFLDIIRPHRIYMGQKDFQQQLIVDLMIQALKIETSLVVCPIKREVDGLAMSSRNLRLTPAFRAKAVVIQAALQDVVKADKSQPPSFIADIAMKRITMAELRPEYIEICDPSTLLPIVDWKLVDRVVVLAAAWAGEIRLIDNVLFDVN